MARDGEEFLCDTLKTSSFSIQVDESKDLTNKCHVVASVGWLVGWFTPWDGGTA